ncbi:MAG TPA: FAD-dependent monooxygenase [Hyphomicrobiales bacterium]|nr:FAD-dependent monooxygenase [Hyphomicrobiales bacterium]
MTDRSATPPILIVGAGLGGLSAALALLRRGFDVEIFEQASKLGEVGAGVQISSNGTRVLYELGVGQELEKLAFTPAGKEVRLWNTGQTWKLFDLGTIAIERFGSPYFTLHRADLHRVLADAVLRMKPNAVHLSSSCVGLEQDADGVRLKLQTGEEVVGAALIGADGVHSRVREILFGDDEATFSGVMSWRGVVPMEQLPDRLRRSFGVNWIGSGGHVVHYPLRGGELMNFNACVERPDWQVESWTMRGTTEECRNDFKGWHDDVHALFSCVPNPHKWALFHRRPLERWTVGRVTLLGDACHSMMPYLAQGAVMALEDGLVLARALEQSDGAVEEGLARYEEARRERTHRVVERSAENVIRFHNPRLADPTGAVEYVEQEWSGARISDRYDWLFTYNAGAVEL